MSVLTDNTVKLYEVREKVQSSLGSTVKYTQQSLTDAQQAQARSNINASPTYSQYLQLTASTTLTDAHYGNFIIVNSASAVTITLPNVPIAYAEMEILNIGDGEVTVSGTMHNSKRVIVLKNEDAITLKSTTSSWVVIGSYEEV